jgi:hypothetical protein
MWEPGRTENIRGRGASFQGFRILYHRSPIGELQEGCKGRYRFLIVDIILTEVVDIGGLGKEVITTTGRFCGAKT